LVLLKVAASAIITGSAQERAANRIKLNLKLNLNLKRFLLQFGNVVLSI